MKLKVIFELEARVELIKISEFYRDKSPDLVLRFQAALEVCFENIRLFPEAFKMVKFGVRRIHLEEFPYIVYYMVDPDAIFIYAIAHNRQDQDYWHHRVSGSQQDS
jgi:toxin ParE1/3/4